jgi:hypothetical protein
LRGHRIFLVCPEAGVVADASGAVGDDAVAFLEAGDLRAGFDDYAGK